MNGEIKICDSHKLGLDVGFFVDEFRGRLTHSKDTLQE